MTKQVTRLAESVASRRGFFGQLAKLAGGVTAGLIVALAPKPASAKKWGYCVYVCPDGSYKSKHADSDGGCKRWWGKCVLEQNI